LKVDYSHDTSVDFILKHEDTTAIIPGAPLFGHILQEKCPNRYIDVGIAEQSAVALAAGMATDGAKAYICAVSSFIQRAYDQIIQD
jgi:1-deoxy-D-xylulose-5-phosphate synthase